MDRRAASTQTEARGLRAQRLREAERRCAALRRSILRNQLRARNEQDVARRARLRVRRLQLKTRLCLLQVEIACMEFLESESDALEDATTDVDL